MVNHPPQKSLLAELPPFVQGYRRGIFLFSRISRSRNNLDKPENRGVGVRPHPCGFPTANLDLHGELLPPPGVYQVVAGLRGQRYAAVANVGHRPTFPGAAAERPLVEVHIPGVDFPFYGETLEVELVRKNRDEVRFADRDALVAQIRRDVASIGLPPR